MSWLLRGGTCAARRYLAGPRQKWVFESPTPDWAPSPLERTSLYLHVPFCRNLCPYCPYTKVPYQEDRVQPYTQAALAEVDWWAERVGQAEVTSIYIGGGTPTLALESVSAILDRVRARFCLTGDICIETSPTNVDQDCVQKMKDAGVAMVSLGVQSFNQKNLQVIGRRYDPPVAARALALLAESGFTSVNADLMFALPGQTVEELILDLEKAAQLGADQITTYPLFTFPYTSVGEYLRLKEVRMPALRERRSHYQAISAWCAANGYERVSVWGFKRGSAPRYSSVTRDGYIGIGPGAGSHLPDGFVLNTFDLEAYIQSACAGDSTIALRLPFTALMSGWWWLYWRFYDTHFSLDAVDAVMGEDAPRARRWLKVLEGIGLAVRRGGFIELTEPGAFWLHLAQNHFALTYVNTLWTQARREAWPPKVAF